MATLAPSRQLAGGQPAATAQAQQYLTFALAGAMYAIGIINVREIIEYGKLTEVPLMPAHIRGVINLRGAVVPVIDLCARFGRPLAEVQRRTCIVIVELWQGGGRQDMGVMVDAVSEVLEIAGDAIEPAPAFGTGIRTDFIAGMGKVEGRFVVLLDIRRVLADDAAAAPAALDSAVAANASRALRS